MPEKKIWGDRLAKAAVIASIIFFTLFFITTITLAVITL